MSQTAAGEAGAQFGEDARPASPGAPYLPPLTLARRIAYGVNGVVIVLLANLGTNLYSTDIGVISGGYGVTSTEGTLLSVLATGVAASAFLYMIKGRQQFGIDRVILWQLWLHAAVSALLLLFPTFEMALTARVTNGMVSATTTALAVYHLLEALPKARRPVALPIVIGCAQVSTALAHLFPIDMLTVDHNRGLHLVCLSIPLVLLALLLANPLPPTLKVKAFEWRDLVAVVLFLPAILLLAGLLGYGRTFWWGETAWLGWMAAAAIPLFMLGFLLESRRENPLLSLPWLGQKEVLGFIAIVLIERITLAEQTSGAIGLMSAAGLNNDQLHGLFAVVILAEIVGIAIVVATLSPAAIPRLVTIALACLAAAAWKDSFSNGQSRPQDLLVSQALIGLGTTLFIGPALVWIVAKVMKEGGQRLVTMILMFSFCQYMGALGSSALVGSYQYVRSEAHGQNIAGDVSAGDAIVRQRIASGTAAASPYTTDPSLRVGVGLGALAKSAQSEAGVLAYLDVFRAIAALALTGIFGMALWTLLSLRRGKADTA